MNSEEEFRKWLKDNREILEKHNIAEMALTVGFKKDVVYPILSFFRDAMGSVPIEFSIEENLIKKLGYVESTLEFKREMNERATCGVRRRLHLIPLWKDVIFYQTGKVV